MQTEFFGSLLPGNKIEAKERLVYRCDSNQFEMETGNSKIIRIKE